MFLVASRQALLVVMSIILAGCVDTHGQATRRPGGRSTARAVAGRGWRQIRPLNRPHPTGPASFFDANIGYGAGSTGVLGNPGALLETVDGGRSWVQIARFPNPIRYLRARPGGVALATLSHASYFVTRLAGATRVRRIRNLRSVRPERPWRPVPPARFPGHNPLLRWRVQTKAAGNTAWALLTSVSNMNQEAYVAYRSTDRGHTFTPIFAGSYSDPDLYDLLAPSADRRVRRAVRGATPRRGRLPRVVHGLRPASLDGAGDAQRPHVEAHDVSRLDAAVRAGLAYSTLSRTRRPWAASSAQTLPLPVTRVVKSAPRTVCTSSIVPLVALIRAN